MEQVLKIRSVQAFSDNNISFNTNTAGLPAGAHSPMNQKIVDFKVPADSGVYDLSRSYLAFNYKMNREENTPDANPINGDKVDRVGVAMDPDGDNSFRPVPHSSLIKNVQVHSQRKGMIESIRRSNLLRNTLYHLEKGEKEKADDPYAFNALNDTQMVSNAFVSEEANFSILNVNANGAVDTNGSKRVQERELRVPLHHFLDFAKNDEFDTSVFGETSIHIETAIDKLKEKEYNGNEAVQLATDATTAQGACDNPAAGPVALDNVTLTALTKDPEQYCPFHIGQQCSLSFDDAGTGGNVTRNGIITQISYQDQGINTNPPSNTKKFKLTFNQAILTSTGDATNLLLKSIGDIKFGYDINFAELVLVKRNDIMKGPEQIDYTTFSVEEDNASGLQVHRKTYYVEPNCTTLFILAANANSDIAIPTNAVNSYRIAVDGVDITGNRTVDMNKALHIERIKRAYNNRGIPFKNYFIHAPAFENNHDDDMNGYNNLSVIAETMPLTEGMKRVEVEITGGGVLSDIVLYKELIKTI